MNNQEILNKLFNQLKEVVELCQVDDKEEFLTCKRERMEFIDVDRDIEYTIENGLLDATFALNLCDSGLPVEKYMSGVNLYTNTSIYTVNVREGEFLPVFNIHLDGKIIYLDSIKELDKKLNDIIEFNEKNELRPIKIYNIEFTTNSASISITPNY